MSPKQLYKHFVDGGTNCIVDTMECILGLPSMGNWAIMGVPIHLLNNVLTS
jgi:hypothetical protein